MLAAANAMLSSDVDNAALPQHFADTTLSSNVSAFSPEAVESAAFGVFKIAGNGEPVLLEGTRSLDAAVARVVGLREWFPGEYLIVSQASGKRIVFTERGIVERR